MKADELSMRRIELILIFKQEFPSEAHANEEICKLIENSTPALKCVKCSALDLARTYGKTVVRCNRCKYKFHLTTRTFFERMRKPLAWLAALWFLENGIRLNSAQLSEIGGTSPSSSWVILSKLSIIVNKIFEENDNSEKFLLPSAEFLDYFSKRSIETPALGHPKDEQFEKERREKQNNSETKEVELPEENSDSHLEPKKSLCDSSKIKLEENDIEVFELLSNAPIHIDEIVNIASTTKSRLTIGQVLSSLMILELNSLAARLPGDLYCLYSLEKNNGRETRKFKSQNKSTIRKIVKEQMNRINQTHRGISRKYLQLYLSIQWCLTEIYRWCSRQIFLECIKSEPIKHFDIKSFSTKLIVQTAKSI